MKVIWLSALNKDEAAVQKVMAQMKKYGLEVQGHFWQNDNAKMAWVGAKEELGHAQVAMWAIMGSREELENPDLRYGLSMLALTAQAQKGVGFPIIIMQTDGDPVLADQLPDPLQRAIILKATDPGTPAKMVAKTHAKPPELPAAYHLDIVGNEQLGQWFTVRPSRDSWPGIIFGVDEGDISFQAVGPPGRLPKKTTLNFPMQGLKLEMGDTSYTAWATQNEVSQEQAYYIKIKGCPKTLLFGPYAEDSEADLYIVRLQ